MKNVRCILVVIDPAHPQSLALRRARLIASVSQSRLHLLVCGRKQDHSAYLNDLREALAAEGHEVSVEQAWRESPYQTVIAAQQAEGCGLVIKQHIPENPLKRALLTSDDWKLLRYCPAPVLMVKTDVPWARGNVLAAVDVDNLDLTHRSLHSIIIDHGHELAGLTQGQLHVVSAHPSPMLSAADPTFQLKETIEARYRESCKRFQAEYAIPEAQLHIEEGPADALIPRVARHLRAVVTVIGSVARTGLSGALMGNTAEVVLEAVASDVLVLKPIEVIEHLERLAAQG